MLLQSRFWQKTLLQKNSDILQTDLHLRLLLLHCFLLETYHEQQITALLFGTVPVTAARRYQPWFSHSTCYLSPIYLSRMSFPSCIIKGEELGIELESSFLSDTPSTQQWFNQCHLLSPACVPPPWPGSRTEHPLPLRQGRGLWIKLCCQTMYPAPLQSIVPVLCSQGIHRKKPQLTSIHQENTFLQTELPRSDGWKRHVARFRVTRSFLHWWGIFHPDWELWAFQ